MPDPDELVLYDAQGREKRLTRVGQAPVPQSAGITPDEVIENTSGALIRVEHSLDPQTQATLQDLRKGVPVAAAAGGFVVGAVVIGTLWWLLSGEEEEEERPRKKKRKRDRDEDDE